MASEFLGFRSPSKTQVKLMEALVSGFLLDYRDWSLWEYIGRSTRAIPDMSQLSGWRTQLAKRFPAIASFHAELSAAFVKTVGYGSETHQRFEPTRHRDFIVDSEGRTIWIVDALYVRSK